MPVRRIEVRYIEQRRAWKAVLLGDQARASVYGPNAADAHERLCELLQVSRTNWRRISTATCRVLFEELAPVEPEAA